MKETEVLPPDTKEEKPEEKTISLRTDIKDVVVTSWEDMQRMATAFSKSMLLPEHLRGPNKLADILVIMQTAKEIGIPPIQAINGIHCIKGKPSISPELQLAMIRAKAPDCFIKFDVDHKKQEVQCTMAPSRDRKDESFTSVWDMERAKAMGLANNDNYKKQPMTMLKWRAAGEAARTIFPHITRGFYNTEEAFDLTLTPPKSEPSLKELFADTNASEKPVIDVTQPSGVEIEKGEKHDD